VTIAQIGAVCFGLVIGWVTYRTLRRKEGTAALSDLASVLGAVGGGVVTALFKTDDMFGYYAIGLAIGFALYFVIGLAVSGKAAAGGWMGE
jgi:hypothetical protein